VGAGASRISAVLMATEPRFGGSFFVGLRCAHPVGLPDTATKRHHRLGGQARLGLVLSGGFAASHLQTHDGRTNLAPLPCGALLFRDPMSQPRMLRGFALRVEGQEKALPRRAKSGLAGPRHTIPLVMAAMLYRCATTGQNVQVWFADDVSDDSVFVSLRCPAPPDVNIALVAQGALERANLVLRRCSTPLVCCPPADAGAPIG
jgi:hypothetical protein